MLTFFVPLKNSTWNSNRRQFFELFLFLHKLKFVEVPCFDVICDLLRNTHFSKLPFRILNLAICIQSFFLSYFHIFFQSFWIFRNSWLRCGQKLSFIFLFWKTLVHLTLQRSVVKSEFSVRQWIHYSAVSFWPKRNQLLRKNQKDWKKLWK